MKWWIFLIACPAFGVAPLAIPSGTNLEVRLTNPVSSSTSHLKDRVEGILIAPVVIGDRTALAGGTVLSGIVAEVAPASDVKPAKLKIQFSKAKLAKGELKLSTRLVGIDNVRETVDGTGTVQGISPKNTITGRMDQGIGKLGANGLGGIAQVLQVAKGILLRNADPNIDYEAGTELTLRLLQPVTVKDAGPYPSFSPVPDNGHLADLVNSQVAQTFAVNPIRPSDVTNLMFIGDLDQIQEAFLEAGWAGATTISGESKWETARAVIEQRGMKEAPVSLILLDDRPPDLVLQKANNTFSARHHLRVWHSPDTYQGQQVWLCGATHDIGIDYSERDGTFIHKIDSNIDLERRKVSNDLLLTGKVRGFTMVARPRVPQHFQNATGDDVNTDGGMAVLQF